MSYLMYNLSIRLQDTEKYQENLGMEKQITLR
jgi:hypothetical protein